MSRGKVTAMAAGVFIFLWSPSPIRASPGQEPVDGEQKSTDVEIGANHETLTGGFAPWSREYIQLTRRITTRKVVYGSFERANRYSLTDVDVTAGAYYPFDEHWTALVEGDVSPTHDFLAKWSMLGQIERDLGHGWATHAGFRHREYVATQVEIGNFGVDKNINTFHFGYAVYPSYLARAGVGLAHRIDATHYYGNSLVNVTVAAGKELENIPPSGVLRMNVRLATLSGVHWFTRSWAASYSINWHNQGKIYTRRGLTLGVRRRL